MPYEERLQNLWSEKYGAASKEHGLKLGSHDSDGISKKLDHLTQYVFKYMGKSIILENTFEKDDHTNVMQNPAYLVFHSQVFKKFKPVKGRRAVKKMKDGTHRTYSLGRGAYRLWDSSRGLKKIMKMEKDDDGVNCTSVEMFNSDSDNITAIHISVNEDFLKQYSLRKQREILFEFLGVGI